MNNLPSFVPKKRDVRLDIMKLMSENPAYHDQVRSPNQNIVPGQPMSPGQQLVYGQMMTGRSSSLLAHRPSVSDEVENIEPYVSTTRGLSGSGMRYGSDITVPYSGSYLTFKDNYGQYMNYFGGNRFAPYAQEDLAQNMSSFPRDSVAIGDYGRGAMY